MKLLKTALQIASDGISYLSNEGSWSMKEHERVVVDAVLSQLDSIHENHFYSQLERPFFIERSNKGRINIFRPYGDVLDISELFPDFSDTLYSVHFYVEKSRNKANVSFYKGNLFSVEFQKPYSFFQDAKLKVESVIRGYSDDSFTRTIDSYEH